MITLEEIRFYAEEASINPNKWYEMMEKVEQLMKEKYGLPEPQRSEELYDITEVINHDMMMSFVFAMSDMRNAEVMRIRTCLNTIDKKWTGPEDEIITGSLVEMARYDIVQRLESLSLNQLISMMLGLTQYFGVYGLHPTITDAKDYAYQLQRYLTTGEYMDTDEHNGCLINNRHMLSELHPNTSLTTVVVTSIFEYLCCEYPKIYSSPYDHSNNDMREYAVYKMLSELTQFIYNKLTNNNQNGLFTAYSEDMMITDHLEFHAMKPILDIGLRIVLYGHILNCDRFAAVKTIDMVWDTLELRRVLENEYIYAEGDISNMEREVHGTSKRETSKKNPREYVKSIRVFGSDLWS